MDREPAYQDLYDDALYALLSIHRKTLGILEQQAAQFTFLHTPPHILLSIEQQQKAISDIKSVLESRNNISKDTISSSYIKLTDSAMNQLDISTQSLNKLEQARGKITGGIVGVIVLGCAFSVQIILRRTVANLDTPILSQTILVIDFIFFIALTLSLIYVINGIYQFMKSQGEI